MTVSMMRRGRVPLTITALLAAALGARADDCAFCEHTGCVHDLATPLRLPSSPIAACVAERRRAMTLCACG